MYLKYDVDYKFSQVQDGPNKDDWLVIATYGDQAAYEAVQVHFAQDANMQNLFDAISKFAKRKSRELVLDIAL